MKTRHTDTPFFLVTHQCVSPTWIKSVSSHKVRIVDLQPYVFCQRYREHNQRRGAARAFQIEFTSDVGEFCRPPLLPRTAATLGSLLTAFMRNKTACRRFNELFKELAASGEVGQETGESADTTT